jgi:hypothetical protein
MLVLIYLRQAQMAGKKGEIPLHVKERKKNFLIQELNTRLLRF